MWRTHDSIAEWSTPTVSMYLLLEKLLQHYRDLTVYLYKSTLYHTIHLSLSWKGSTKYAPVIPLHLVANKHMALIKNLEQFYRRLTRSVPTPEGYSFCRICFNTFLQSGNMTLHECKCNFTQTLVYRPMGSKIN